MTPSAQAGLQIWYDRWINPVLGEFYRRDIPAARGFLDAALANLDQPPCSPDEQAARHLLCLRAEYYIERLANYSGGLQEVFESFHRRLEGFDCSGPVARRTRAWQLLMISIAAERDGTRDLTAERFDSLLAEIPPEHRPPELWNDLAPWLFTHERTELLREAYEVLLTHPLAVKQLPFRRVKLMHQILNGTVTEQEILAYLNNLELVNATYEFIYFIWPVLAERGHATPEIERAMQATLQRLLKDPPHSPYDD